MGADYAKYCTCLNKESQTQEASLSRRVISFYLNIKDYYPMQDEENQHQSNNNPNHQKPLFNSNLASGFLRSKAVPFRSSMSSESTDRADHSMILIQKINYPNGDLYIGKVQNNKREGKGKLTFKAGGYYEGDFHDDHFEGYGTLCTETSVYYGNFALGEKSGKGKSENKTEGTEYVGQWMNNAKNGFGKEVYSDGAFFEGDYLKGMKNGKGVLCLANGLKYSGQLVNDNIEGQGTFVWNDNKRYTGSWKSNNLSGFGVLTQAKDQHIGFFNNDRKNGFGLNYFFKSNSFLIGHWTEDSVKGLAIFVSPNQEYQLWQMEDNKLTHYHNTFEERQKIINSEAYQKLKEFFLHLKITNLIADLPIDPSFSL